MTKNDLRKHERTVIKAVFVLSLLTLMVVGSTIVAMLLLRAGRSPPEAAGWKPTREIRVVMDSTSDWGRIMFNDLYGTDLTGLRVAEFRGHGWLSGNDSNSRIDVGRGLVFIDIIYNATVVKKGDIIGFFKGNNNFKHTRMYSDVILEANMGLMSVSIYLILAGAGTTTFEFIDKQSGAILWRDTASGSSFTQYVRRSMSPNVFLVKQRIQDMLVFALIAATVLTVASLNLLPRRGRADNFMEDGAVF